MATTDGPKPAPACVSGSPAERDLLARRKADAEHDARMEYRPDPYASEDEEKHAFFIPVWAFALGLLLGLVLMAALVTGVVYFSIP